MSLVVNFIGAGHLGKTLAHLLLKNNLVQIAAICNKSIHSAKAAIQFIGGGEVCTTIKKLPAANIIFITTPDDLIADMASRLSDNPYVTQDTLVVHCSGSLSSEALEAVQQKGAQVASIHPMRSFANPEVSIEHYQGTYCAMEGSAQALAVLQPLFDAIGSITYRVDKQKKSLYHAAGVFASNYVVTLAQQALSCLQEAGIEQEIAIPIITNLMRGTVANLENTCSPQQALTGPIKRGDTMTVAKHMEAFSEASMREAYAALGKATLALTSHDVALNDVLKKILTS